MSIDIYDSSNGLAALEILAFAKLVACDVKFDVVDGRAKCCICGNNIVVLFSDNLVQVGCLGEPRPVYSNQDTYIRKVAASVVQSCNEEVNKKGGRE